MSELIERVSPYTTQLPSESSERLPSEAERKLWLMPEAVEIEETQIEEPDLAASWQDLKHSFGGLRERTRTAGAEMRSIGRLAMLDINGASSIMHELRSNSSQLPDIKDYRRLGLKDRIRLNAEDILREKKYNRRNRIREVKRRAEWSAAAVGASALTGYLSVKLAELIN